MNKILNKQQIFELVEKGQLSSEKGLELIKQIKATLNNTSSGSAQQSLLFFETEWNARPHQIEPQPSDRQANEVCLVFDIQKDIGKEVQDLMEKQYNVKSGVILIKPGTSFQKIDSDTYEINPAIEEDYLTLMKSLQEQSIVVGEIIHLWATDKNKESDSNPIKYCLQAGFYSLFYLSRSLMSLKPTLPIRLLFVFNQDGSVQHPLYSAISGFARTIGLENPKFAFKTLQCASSAEMPASPLLSELAAFLIKELQSDNKDEVEIMLKDGNRFVKHVRELPLASSSTEDDPGALQPFKDNGVYLITGGLGGLGLIFTKFALSLANKVDLILLGRSVLPESKQETIHALETGDSKATYYTCDVSDNKQLGTVLKQIREKHGPINGIIHSAGVIKDSFILRKTASEINDVFTPKIQGTINLDELTRDDPLDFFILFSSIAAIRGNIGQADYSFANRFLDEFASLRDNLVQKSQRKGKSVAIAWPVWEEGGMRIDEETANRLKERIGMESLQTQNGIKAFTTTLNLKKNQLIVLAGNRNKLSRFFITGGSKKQAKSLQQPVTQSKIVSNPNLNDLKQKTESYLKQLLSKESKIPKERIKNQEQFESYGINSALIMSITRELEAHFGELSKTLFFEYLNLADLTDYFLQNHAGRLEELLSTPEDQQSSGTKAIKAAPSPDQPHKRWNRLANSKRPSFGSKTESSESDIAIIGLSGIYPQAEDLEQFWENLKIGKDCISEIPQDRWDVQPYYDPDKSKR